MSGVQPHDLSPYLFLSPDGLRTKTAFDRIECAIAFDFECVREIPALVDYIRSIPFLDREKRALEYVHKLPYLCRWAPGLIPGKYYSNPHLEPIIPTASVVCPWFPNKWLFGSREDRHEIVRLLERAYQTERPLHLLPYPLPADTEQQFRAIPGCKLYTITINTREAPSRSIRRLVKALTERGHTARRALPRHGYDAINALHRLVYYRISKLPPEERPIIVSELQLMGIKVPKNALSQAKRQMLAHFRKLNWSCLLQK